MSLDELVHRTSAHSFMMNTAKMMFDAIKPLDLSAMERKCLYSVMTSLMREKFVGIPLYLNAPTRSDAVTADSLLPPEIWMHCLQFASKTSYESAWCYKEVDEDEEEPFVYDAEMGPLQLRPTCVLFSKLALEVLTDITIRNRVDKDSHFPTEALVDVLLSRPCCLKNFEVEFGCLMDTSQDSLRGLVNRLTQAKELSSLELNVNGHDDSFSIIEGYDIRRIVTACNKLKCIEIEADMINGSIDLPASCRSLESIKFVSGGQEEDEEDEENVFFLEPPNFESYLGLSKFGGGGAQISRRWLFALSSAPCLVDLSDCSSRLDRDAIREFLLACQSKQICTTLRVLRLGFADYDFAQSGVDDQTLKLLLICFPCLKSLQIVNSAIRLHAPLLNQLQKMTQLTHLDISHSLWEGPTSDFLASSCKMFPKNLQYLKLNGWSWNNEMAVHEDNKSQHLQLVKASFSSCLPNLSEKGFSCKGI